MAGSAIFAKLTFMGILSGVTGKAIAGRICEDTVDMASLAVHVCVRTDQFESGCIVIELSRFPRCSGVTLLADSTELTHMRIDLLMT